MKIARLKYRVISKLFPRVLTSDMVVNHLKEEGIQIGKGTALFNPSTIIIDTQRPTMLSIGEYCKITAGVVILAHDYSRSVLRRVYGEIIAEARETRVGNNVFIGMNSIILMGTSIGDNCIIGAGSVCHGKYPANSVIAGNPAKVIMTLDEYYKKRKEKYVDEALAFAHSIYKEKGRIPTINEMEAFFPLYLDRNINEIKRHGLFVALSGDEEEEVIDGFLKTKPVFDSYDDFLEHCGLLDKKGKEE